MMKKKLLLIISIVCGFCSVSASSATFDSIPPLAPVVQAAGRPHYMPIWSPLYELSGNSIYPGSPYVQTTLYEPYNDLTRGWWDNILEEFMYAGINNSLILTRAAMTESGEWNTLKTNLVPGLNRAGMYGFMKFGQFEDCGAWLGAFQSITGRSTIDWSDSATMVRIMWDQCVKRFFDFMPVDLQLQYNGKPVWVGWASGGINLQGNVSKVLREVKKRFKAQYNKDLFIIIDNSWRKGDASITAAEADGVQNWFCCGTAGTFFTFNNLKVGVCVPGFGVFNSAGTPAPHGATFDRNHGQRLRQFLDSSITSKADFMIEEGYVDLRESAGIYRSPSWDYPSQYLEIVREYLDGQTQTRRFQAEACDSFYNKSNTNSNNAFSSRRLDVGTLPSPNFGWYVDGTDPGDWLLWKSPYFANGTYDIYIRYASMTASDVTLSMGGKSDNISLPSTSGIFQGKKILSARTLSGNNDVKLTMQTAGIQIDFLHCNRTDNVGAKYHATDIPSPFTGAKMVGLQHRIRIDYSVPYDNSILNMQVLTMKGRTVWHCITPLVGGKHTVEWLAATSAAGAYIVNWKVSKLNSNESVSGSNKVMLLSR